MRHSYPVVTLGLLLVGTVPLAAQDLTNNGAIISVGSGATLYVAGGLDNASGTLTTAGTVQVGGPLSNAGTLDLSSGSVTVKGNLTNTGTVVPGTGTVTLDGAANQILSWGGATLYRLTLNKTTAGGDLVNVPTDLTISNQLGLTNGMMRTAPTATVTLLDGATLPSEADNRYVQGNLRAIRNSVSGSSAVSFANGASIDPNGSVLGQVQVTRSAGLVLEGVTYASNPNNAGARSIDRIWTIVPAAQPTTPAELTLSWLAANDNGLSPFAQAQVWREDGANGWQTVGPQTSANSRTITVTTSVLDSRWTVSNRANPLPVELVRFTAERRGADALLRWATAQEKNNDRFEVEVSPDGQQFRRLGRVAGHGSTTTRHDYEYLDPQLARYAVPLLYYRLRQVDFDGTATLSEVRTLRLEGTSVGFAAAASPNPYGAEGVTLEVQAPEAGSLTLLLHDAVGRTLFSTQATVEAGTSKLLLPRLARLPAGVYYLAVRLGKHHTSLKLVRE